MNSRRRLAIILSALFVFALFMGPGPGVWLVNPDPADPDAHRTLLGAPIIYVWAVLWFAVEAAIVIIAAMTLWKPESAEPEGDA